MLSYITTSIARSSNYGIMNIDNIYKFNIITMEMLSDDQKKKYLENMKLQVGMTFYKEFRGYIFNKFPKSELLKYFED